MQLVRQIRNLGVFGLLVVYSALLDGGCVTPSKIQTPTWVVKPDGERQGHAVHVQHTFGAQEARRQVNSLRTGSDEKSFLEGGERKRLLRPPPPRLGRFARARKAVRDSLRRIFRPARHALLTELKQVGDELERHLERVAVLNAISQTSSNDLQAMLKSQPGLQCDDRRLEEPLRKACLYLKDAQKFMKPVGDTAMRVAKLVNRMKKMKGSTVTTAVEEAKDQVKRSSLLVEITDTITGKLCALCPSAPLCEEALRVPS